MFFRLAGDFLGGLRGCSCRAEVSPHPCFLAAKSGRPHAPPRILNSPQFSDLRAARRGVSAAARADQACPGTFEANFYGRPAMSRRSPNFSGPSAMLINLFRMNVFVFARVRAECGCEGVCSVCVCECRTGVVSCLRTYGRVCACTLRPCSSIRTTSTGSRVMHVDCLVCITW
jgi:hypothetical protein